MKPQPMVKTSRNMQPVKMPSRYQPNGTSWVLKPTVKRSLNVTNYNQMKNTDQPGGLEMTTFKLTKGTNYKDFIAANADVDKWLKVQPGFQSRYIAQSPDGTIIDALIWDSEADGTNAMHRLMTELAGSPVHDTIDQGTVSWNIYPVYHQLPDGK